MPSVRTLPPLLALALAACSSAVAEPTPTVVPPAHSSRAIPTPSPAVREVATASTASRTPPESVCNEQAPQTFLMRSSYAFRPDAPLDERQRRRALHDRAVQYRTREYGYVEGFGSPRDNALEPKHYAVVRPFFGVRVRMNIRVLTALQCVEQAIRWSCDESPYQPKALHGLRFENTFHDNEVSNHLYGIAIDVDPDDNPCCGCVAPARNVPLCRQPAATPLDRAQIPRCWIDAFERYGFYWLGNDELEDTMHFEFLGDPDKILKSPSS